jgi:hypothetical protein
LEEKPEIMNRIETPVVRYCDDIKMNRKEMGSEVA